MRAMKLSSEAQPEPTFPKFTLSLATSISEVHEVQRLRYKVFIETMGISALANPEGLERDEFDDYCDHLLVRDALTKEVIGAYRLLSPESARRAGISSLRDRMIEIGRACIHPDYRSGGVIMMLWAGIAAFMRREQCEFLVGCASISLADGGGNAAAIYQGLPKENIAPAAYRVVPHLPFPINAVPPAASPQMPPLLKGYLRSGAWVCGQPAWDPDFHCADLFMILSLARLEPRYARHYLGSGETEMLAA
jgi:putative hemolysin